MNATPEEQWLAVLDYEGYYEVSDRGRVRSVERIIAHTGDNRRRRWKSRMLNPALRPDGRYKVSLHRHNHGLNKLVHVAVLEAFVGPRPVGLLGCHRNGIPTDNRIENLYWGTPSENVADCLMHGNHTNANKTRCKRDHEYTAENTYIIPSTGGRLCRKCMRINMDIYKERHGL